MDVLGAQDVTQTVPTNVDLATPRPGADALIRKSDEGLIVSCVGDAWSDAVNVSLPTLAEPLLACVRAEARAGTAEVSVMAGDLEICSRALRGPGLHDEYLAVPAGHGDLRLLVRTTATGRPVVARLAAVSLESVVPQPVAADELLAIYDLDVRTAGYSAVMFVLAADAARRVAGLSGVRLVVVPETSVGERRLADDFRRAYPARERRVFIERLLGDLVRLLPGWRAPEVVEDRRVIEGLVAAAPAAYGAHPDPRADHGPVVTDFRAVLGSPDASSKQGRLVAPEAVRVEVTGWLRDEGAGRRIITLSPRAEEYEPEANTNLDEWRAWAEGREELVVLVPDPRSPAPCRTPGPWVVPPWSDFVCNQALFEVADMNLAAYGEHSLPLLGGTASFVMWVPPATTTGMYSRAALTSLGFLLDGRTPGLMPHQRLAFEIPSPSSLTEALLFSKA